MRITPKSYSNYHITSVKSRSCALPARAIAQESEEAWNVVNSCEPPVPTTVLDGTTADQKQTKWTGASILLIISIIAIAAELAGLIH